MAPADATRMTKRQINAELRRLERDFANRGEHGGSPGEWLVERMGVLETELRRREEGGRG